VTLAVGPDGRKQPEHARTARQTTKPTVHGRKPNASTLITKSSESHY
jgi:hypothetical protein